MSMAIFYGYLLWLSPMAITYGYHLWLLLICYRQTQCWTLKMSFSLPRLSSDASGLSRSQSLRARYRISDDSARGHRVMLWNGKILFGCYSQPHIDIGSTGSLCSNYSRGARGAQFQLHLSDVGSL